MADSGTLISFDLRWDHTTIQIKLRANHIFCSWPGVTALFILLQVWQLLSHLLAGGLVISSLDSCLHSSSPLWVLLALYCFTLESVFWCSCSYCFCCQRLGYKRNSYSIKINITVNYSHPVNLFLFTESEFGTNGSTLLCSLGPEDKHSLLPNVSLLVAVIVTTVSLNNSHM